MGSGTARLAELSRAAGLLCALAFAGALHAGTRCDPAQAPGRERCVSGVPTTLIAQMQQNQEASHWDWAAGVSMMLRRYGLSVSQQQVAREHLGRLDNVPVGADTVADLMNRSWRDGHGRHLVSSAAPLPTWRRHLGVEAPEVLRELDEGRPMLLVVQQRVLVLVQLVVERPIAGSGDESPARIVRAVVLDPAHPAMLRSLRSDEGRIDHVVRVAVENGLHTERAAHAIPPRVADGPEQLASGRR